MVDRCELVVVNFPIDSLNVAINLSHVIQLMDYLLMMTSVNVLMTYLLVCLRSW